MASSNTEKFKKSYRFFVEMQKDKKGFKRDDIAKANLIVNALNAYQILKVK